jgi:hypothetical protein
MATPLLKGKFAPLKGIGAFSTLSLFPDAVVWKRLGQTRRFPITDIESVDWSATQGTGANFSLTLRSGEKISGTLTGAALWKFKLRELAAQRGDSYARLAGPPGPPEPHEPSAN